MQTNSQSNILKSLLAARADFGPIVKDKVNPHYKSRYADLETVLDAVSESLAKHGLLLVQRTEVGESGHVLLTELVEVASSDKIVSTYPLVPSRPNDPQALGSALTYARRYSILALLGVAAEDDDGQKASQQPRREASQAPRQQKQEAPAKQPERQQQQQQQPKRAKKPLPPLSSDDKIALDEWRLVLGECQSLAELASQWDRLDSDFKLYLQDLKDEVKTRLSGGAS